MGRSRLRSKRILHPYYGVHFSDEAATSNGEASRETEAIRRAAEYAPLLRAGESFSHTTALLLHGTPIRALPQIHVTAPLPFGQARRVNVIGHRSVDPLDHVLVPGLGRGDTLRCATPGAALLQSGGLLSFRELVVAIDHLILPRGPKEGKRALLSAAELATLLETASGRGIRRVRAAFEVARVGAESRMESLTHFEMARIGIDVLELQADIFDEGGVWIGRFDQADREARRLLEYDGDQHRAVRAQYLKDLDRLERARAAGYGVLRLQMEHLRRSALPATRELICGFLGRRPQPVPARLARYFAEG